MSIGNQIKMLRLRHGATQEEMARSLGITAQAVSKWECGLSTPDISMLPELSAYLGVHIDDLFDMSDDLRIDRIQNMLWRTRFLDPDEVENDRRFLLELGEREPNSEEAYCILAQLELHLAGEHYAHAEKYALEAMQRNPYSYRGFAALSHALEGTHVDPRHNTHNQLISHYETHLEQYPDAVDCYAWLIAQYIDDNRLNEARRCCDAMEQYVDGYYLTVHRIKIALAENDVVSARAMWEQMRDDYPDNWSVHHWIGDFQTQVGDYMAAKESYQNAIAAMKSPHFTDPFDSLAQVCEMEGDVAGAIAVKKLEREVLHKEWGDTTGESIDCIDREIRRLERMSKRSKSYNALRGQGRF